MRLVLDTNVVVAALLWNGPPRSLLDLAVDSGVEFFSSPVLIEELAHTLSYAVPQWRQQIEAVAQLPKSQQQFIARMIEMTLAQAVAR